MEIKKINQDQVEDFRSLINIFKEVFENTDEIPGNTYLLTLLLNPNFTVFVVKINNTVVGGLTIYTLYQYYSEKPLAYIYDVGITSTYQRKGLGKALMEEVCRFCEQNGFETAYVEAEADDEQAVSFYRKTRYSLEMNAIHFNYSLDNQVLK